MSLNTIEVTFLNKFVYKWWLSKKTTMEKTTWRRRLLDTPLNKRQASSISYPPTIASDSNVYFIIALHVKYEIGRSPVVSLDAIITHVTFPTNRSNCVWISMQTRSASEPRQRTTGRCSADLLSRHGLQERVSTARALQGLVLELPRVASVEKEQRVNKSAEQQ